VLAEAISDTVIRLTRAVVWEVASRVAHDGVGRGIVGLHVAIECFALLSLGYHKKLKEVQQYEGEEESGEGGMNDSCTQRVMFKLSISSVFPRMLNGQLTGAGGASFAESFLLLGPSTNNVRLFQPPMRNGRHS